MVQAKHDSRETIFLSTLIIKNRGVFFDFLHCHFRALLTCSGIPKAEGLRPKSKVSHLRLRLRWPMVYAAEGRRSSWRLKRFKFSKFKCKFCDKNFRMMKVHICSVFKKVEILYYIIFIRAFQSLCLNAPTKYLNTKYQTFGFTLGFDFQDPGWGKTDFYFFLWKGMVNRSPLCLKRIKHRVKQPLC